MMLSYMFRPLRILNAFHKFLFLVSPTQLTVPDLKEEACLLCSFVRVLSPALCATNREHQ